MSIRDTAPEGAKVLDVGAARVARAEARAAAGDGLPWIKVTAGYIEVRPEVDLEAAEDFLGARFRAGLMKLLVDPADVDVLLSDGLSKGDLDAIGEFITGTTQGESLASSKS